MRRVITTRTLLVGVFLWAVALAGSKALAQDPGTTAAQNAAREWLALTDRGDAQTSWRSAGKKFKAALPASGWADALKKARQPLGAMTSRSMLSTRFEKTLPGAPDGDYSLIVFHTSFANKTEARETVTLERESDGVWRVIGYFIS